MDRGMEVRSLVGREVGVRVIVGEEWDLVGIVRSIGKNSGGVVRRGGVVRSGAVFLGIVVSMGRKWDCCGSMRVRGSCVGRKVVSWMGVWIWVCWRV